MERWRRRKEFQRVLWVRKKARGSGPRVVGKGQRKSHQESVFDIGVHQYARASRRKVLSTLVRPARAAGANQIESKRQKTRPTEGHRLPCDETQDAVFLIWHTAKMIGRFVIWF